ncbi:MAG: VOC family protein [Acidiphilium sp.]|nr:VOC family protein [Acidiphilium sp.]MDD4936674.1 VOC family protein [Acidiphilium sp.]
MSKAIGSFIWYELMTTDTAAAVAFYRAVVGWDSAGGSTPDPDYTILTAAGARVAGVMEIPPVPRAAGMKPCWRGYVWVADVDATAAEIVRLGGAVHFGPHDIPTVGRIASVSDPQGAIFALFSPDGTGDGGAAQDAVGHVAWHELRATDWTTAFTFYEALFGWQKAEAMDMGAMGVYQLVSSGGAPMGAMFNLPEAPIGLGWLYYINVGDIDAAVARIGTAGGTVVTPPMPVPGERWIVQGLDPQGVAFALVGMRG